MYRILTVMFFIIPLVPRAQHCPWDCGGMILVKTNISPEKVYKLSPVMVDEDKNIVVDTIYGTGKPTYDTCKLLYYDDFQEYRTQRINLHYWYGYDTVYHFAAGFYVIKTNFCEYSRNKMYLRINDLSDTGARYHYIEIPRTAFIHLHEYNNEIRERRSGDILKAVENAVIKMDCEKWMLPEKDCK